MKMSEEKYTWGKTQYDVNSEPCGDIIMEWTVPQIMESLWVTYSYRCKLVRMEPTKQGCLDSWCREYAGIKL